MKKTITLNLTLLLSLCVFAGCSNSQSTQQTNEMRFSLADISSLTISYDEEDITFFESENDELVIKEYMTESKDSYYAKVTERNDSIKITEGGKPFFKSGFTRYIEVYLPENYHESLTVTSTNGNLDLTGISPDLAMLSIDNTSGKIKLNHVTASEIKLSTTSGSVTCSELNGNVTYTSTSGDAEIKSAVGSGSYKVNNSGNLDVEYAEVTGDLTFFNKNDRVKLTLPEDLSFEFEATTKNGSVSTTFQQDVTINGRTTSGVVGEDPTVTVKVETKNGDIEVMQ